MPAYGGAVNVADEDSVLAARDAVHAADLPTVGAVLNIAGITSPVPFLETTLELWNKIFAVNATGTYLVTKAFLPDMIDGGYGRIVNMSSVSAQQGGGVFGKTPYSSAKAAVIGFTRSLARELGPTGITVNAIAAGAVDTDIRVHGTTPETRGLHRGQRPAGPAGLRRRRHRTVRVPGLRGGRLHHRAPPRTSTAAPTSPDPHPPTSPTPTRTPLTKESAMTQTVDRGTRVADLAAAADRIRHHILDMGEVQGQGYVGQGLGFADVLAVIYKDLTTYHPEDPHWDGRDRVLLSMGHYAIAEYAALAEAGIIPVDELETYGSDDSRLPMSGMSTYTPGMEISGGSLGHGLGVAVGMALGLRFQGNTARVVNMMSDGELDEGSTWEAAMAAVPPRPGEPAVRGRHERPAGRRPHRRGAAHRTASSTNGRRSGGAPSASTATTSTPWSTLSTPSRPETAPRWSSATPASAAACRSWKPGKRRTSSASTNTNGTSPARRCAPPTPPGATDMTTTTHQHQRPHRGRRRGRRRRGQAGQAGPGPRPPR